MYEDFYGLKEKPFSIQPDPSFLYWGRGHRLAYAMLEYGVVNRAGISVVTGEVGCGKTTLIHRLLEQLSDTHTIALLSNIQPGRGDLLSWVLMGFGEPFAGKNHVEMFAQLQSFFISEYAKGKRVVLIIDEAQNLSADMLEELRMLSNINAGKDQLLQLILVGQPQLKDILSRPDMLQLAQRVGSDFHLTPLTREEVRAYIDTRLSIAGAQRNIFETDAMDLIAEHSRGVPRVINTIADTALVYAFSAQQETVGADIVRSVIRDKLDYGVFGLASSPDLKLAEEDPRRRAAGFPTEEPHVKPMSVSLNLNETFRVRAEPHFSAASLHDAERDAATAPRPAVRRPPAGPAETGAPARRAEEPAVVAAPAASANSVAASEIGIVIINADEKLALTARSAPDGAIVVATALAGGRGADAARACGVDLVEIDPAGFTPGRARNAGYRRLKKLAPQLKFVQFVESGVEIDPDWVAVAVRFMNRRPEVAALEGATIYRSASGKTFAGESGRWSSEDGELQAAGRNAFFRADAFEAAGGFRGDIVADETADLCIRLRRRGAHVWRSEEPMAVVDQSDSSFSAWRRRAVEDGYLYAAGAALHGAPPEKYCVREQARAVIWGAAFPVAVFISAITGGIAMALLPHGVNPFVFSLSILAAGGLVYGLKVFAAAAANGLFKAASWTNGAKATLRHFYEYAGVARYWFSSRKGAKA